MNMQLAKGVCRYATEVDVIGFKNIGEDQDNAPEELREINQPRNRRQVWLRNTRGERLGYAASWWCCNDVSFHPVFFLEYASTS